jgi:hypothetical protein
MVTVTLSRAQGPEFIHAPQPAMEALGAEILNVARKLFHVAVLQE